MLLHNSSLVDWTHIHELGTGYEMSGWPCDELIPDLALVGMLLLTQFAISKPALSILVLLVSFL